MNSPVQMIGLGELLWDCFPDMRLPGGAPANVAFHAQQLGLTAAVATRVGEDESGYELVEFLKSRNLRTDLVQIDPVHDTGTVNVWPSSTVGTGYTFKENSAWDFIDHNSELMAAVITAEAVCFGTLAQRRPVARTSIHLAVRSASKDCLIVYDVNLRPPFYVKDWIAKSLSLATVVKMNDDEVKILSKLLEYSSTEEIPFVLRLLDEFPNLQLACVTRGSHGCMAATRDETLELDGIPIEVADTVGAGDAFTAAIIYGRLQKWSLAKTLELANQFGSLVASRPGAMPTLHGELERVKQNLEWSFRDTAHS